MRKLMLPALCLIRLVCLAPDATAETGTVPQQPPRLGTLACAATGTFGDTDGPGALLIPLDVTADPDGNVYVLDHDAGCVLRYAPDGRYLGRIGRRGEGPGELRRARNLVATDDGRIAVFDIGPRRFSFFDRDGDFLGTLDYQGDVRSLQAASDGTLVGVFRYPHRGWIEQGMPHRVVLFPPGGEPAVVDSLRILSHQIVRRTAEATTNVARPFAPGLHAVVLPSGWIVVAHGDRYRLQWIRPDRTGRRALERDTEPVPVTDAERKAFLDNEIQDSPEIADALRRRLDFPDRHPPIDGLAAGPDGSLLVLRPGPADEIVCDVHGGDGELLGAARGPRPAGRLCFCRGALYAIGEISDDAPPVVTRYRVAIDWTGAR